jgi:hypothetical protein
MSVPGRAGRIPGGGWYRSPVGARMAAGRLDEVAERSESPLLPPPEHDATRTTMSRALEQPARRLITERR